jgi:hypothetical protein
MMVIYDDGGGGGENGKEVSLVHVSTPMIALLSINEGKKMLCARPQVFFGVVCKDLLLKSLLMMGVPNE